MTTYEAVIGLEVHIELQTQSKMFTSVDAHFFGQEPNHHVNPLCLGMPGTLPVINEEAVAYAVMMGMALNCKVHPHSVFARKHYWYPDLPKGYQISQYEEPICTAGYLDVQVQDQTSHIRISRLHLEEDTGKLTHVGHGSLVDLNRAGVPLMEIVTEPDIHTADEAYAYVSKLRQLVRYLGISSGDMEKGAMRCEVNLSMRPVGTEEFGTKVEVKNLNSFRTVRNAIDYEIKRQTKILQAGGEVEQVTMGWDENKNMTVVQRSKEDAHDYRYFPEPDLPPLDLDPVWLEALQARLPELPDQKLDRYVQEWSLPRQDAVLLIENRERARFFEQVMMASEGKLAPKSVANWFTGEIFRLLNEGDLTPREIKFEPSDLTRLIELVETNAINRLAGKEVLSTMWETGDKPDAIVEAKGLKQISDSSVLDDLVAQIISEHPGPVEQFKGGKQKVIGFLVGQVMRLSKGKANPKMVEQCFRKKLG